MKINKMHLTYLRNEEHFQFMSDVKALIDAAGATTLNIDKIYPDFVALYNLEDLALETIRKSALTDSIADADRQRDSIVRGFELYIESCTHSPNAEKAQAAHNVSIIVAHYGHLTTKSYNEETASIYNLLQDLNGRCATDILTLNAQEWVDELDVANKNFDELMNKRFDEGASRETANMRDTRRKIDATYNLMVDHINASIFLNGEAGYTNFVNQLNERIIYFNLTIAQRKGRAAAKRDKED